MNPRVVGIVDLVRMVTTAHCLSSLDLVDPALDPVWLVVDLVDSTDPLPSTFCHMRGRRVYDQ